MPRNISFNKEHRPENDPHRNAADVKSTEEYLQRNPNDEQSRATGRPSTTIKQWIKRAQKRG
jgi:hypothetical protein